MKSSPLSDSNCVPASLSSLYAQLELIPPKTLKPITESQPETIQDRSNAQTSVLSAQTNSFLPGFFKLRHTFLQALTKVSTGLITKSQLLLQAFGGSAEPHITVFCDRHHKTYFQVYDPGDRSHHLFDSEQALRTWIDQRYYC